MHFIVKNLIHCLLGKTCLAPIIFCYLHKVGNTLIKSSFVNRKNNMNNLSECCSSESNESETEDGTKDVWDVIEILNEPGAIF